MLHKPDGYTIFCDDIRQEVGNKASLMGVYGIELFVQQPFPVVLRMGFYIVLKEDMRAPHNNTLLRIFYPGDPDDEPSFAVEINRTGIKPPPIPETYDELTRRISGLHIVNMVTLKEPGKIKVRMLVDGEEVKLGTLSVRAPQTATP